MKIVKQIHFPIRVWQDLNQKILGSHLLKIMNCRFKSLGCQQFILMKKILFHA